jgi:hypothetical protein
MIYRFSLACALIVGGVPFATYRAIAQDSTQAQCETQPTDLLKARCRVEELERRVMALQRQLDEARIRFNDLQQQRDRIALERDNLMRRFGGGRGLTWPSCFIAEGGGSQSILRITINDSSVRVEDLGVQPQHEIWRLPRAAAFRGHTDEGSRGQFQALFAELFQWSAAHDCRFIVRLSDATCESCKQEWNSARLWVGGFFYPDER